MDENRTLDASADGRQPRDLSLRFDGAGFDIFGWSILYILSYLLLSIPMAWWYRGFYRWVMRNLTVEDGTTATFEAEPKQIWFWFLPVGVWMVASQWVESQTIRQMLDVANLLYSFVLSWVVLRWLAAGIRYHGHVNFNFTGRLRSYIGWSIASRLSNFTVIGWAWVDLAFLRWIFLNFRSENAELKFMGKSTGFLVIGSLCFLLPGAIILLFMNLPFQSTLRLLITWIVGIDSGVNPDPEAMFPPPWKAALVVGYMLSIPWLIAVILRWFTRRTRLIVNLPAPVAEEAPSIIA